MGELAGFLIVFGGIIWIVYYAVDGVKSAARMYEKQLRDK